MAGRRPISLAVGKAIKEAKLRDPDAGAIALVKRYAALMDDVDEMRQLADAAAKANPDASPALRRLLAKVNDLSVVSDIGPKLLAALTALGLTPAGRGQHKEGGTRAQSGDNPLAALRAEHDEVARKRRAKAANSAAT